MIVDSRTVAWCGMAGTICDGFGGIYLTYELLGGRRGPLGLLTRAATYGLIFGLGYGLVFGFAFGMIGGVGLGLILALEYWRVARHQHLYGSSPLYHLPFFGVARALIIGLAIMPSFGVEFGVIFGVFGSLALYVVYKSGYAPTNDYSVGACPRVNPRVLRAAVLRGLMMGAAGAAAASLESMNAYSLRFGVTVGLSVGLISAIIGLISPFVEWWIENLPEKYLAALGFLLILTGLVLQSVQYAAVLLHITR
jgi:hypothetical protein